LQIHLELSEIDLKKLIKEYFESRINSSIDYNLISIQVKSKQNYKSEWEEANFRATYDSSKL
jgi:hypothetical protein